MQTKDGRSKVNCKKLENMCQGSIYIIEERKYSPAVERRAITMFANTSSPRIEVLPAKTAFILLTVRKMVANNVYAIISVNPDILMVNSNRALSVISWESQSVIPLRTVAHGQNEL